MNPTRIKKNSHLLYWATQGHKMYIGGEVVQHEYILVYFSCSVVLLAIRM